jgi:arylsulfatase A-like enzyme
MRRPVRFPPAVLVACLLSSTACGPPRAGSGNAPGGGARPNVLLIIVDTLRADRLGCYGSPGNTTPEIDALAAEGVRFERVIAPASWTRPSIGALLTGQHPRTLGLYREEDEILADRFTTLAEALRDRGYATFGMTANPHINRAYNFDQGFGTYLDSHVLFPFMNPADARANYNKSTVRPARELFEVALAAARGVTDRPVYLQINIMEVHEYNRGPRTLTGERFRSEFGAAPDGEYRAAVRQASSDIGAFTARLAALPGWEDALIVITSDHGEGLGDHPGVLRGQFHGFVVYESQVRVPLILVRRGGLPAGRVVATPVRLVDLFPTLLDHIGIAIPPGIAGRTLVPLLGAGTADPGLPRHFVAESRFRDVNKIAVYGGDWCYIENRDGWAGVNPRELQPRGGGENGVWTDRIEQQPEIAAALRDYLAQWEASHPPAPPTLDRDALSPEEEEQLRSIGYF